MSYFTTKDNTRIYYKDWGSGSTVILIHGWPLSSDSWEEQAIALVNAGHRVIAYDRRGFGRSSQPWHGYDYNTLADDLAALISHTAVNDVALVGFSMGGGEVARYMSRHNAKSVVKAALISSVVPFRLKTEDNPSGTEQEAFDKTARAINKDRAAFFTEFFNTFFGVGTPGNNVSDELLRHMAAVAMQGSIRATLECLKAFSSTDFRPDLEHFKVPTLIIHGTEDKTVPIDASARLAAAGISQATLIEYHNAPHGLFVTDKDKLTKDILTFIR